MLKKIYTSFLYIFALIGLGLVGGYLAIKLGLTKTPGIIDKQSESFIKSLRERPLWTEGEEWEILKEAVIRDREVLEKAAKDAHIDPRLLVALLVPEQMRLFESNRELFKRVFYPLKILGNQSQFSWGIMGIKKETAITIEKNLKDPYSQFYPGKEYQHILDFSTEDSDKERFERIIDEKNHYYSYLYAALYLKEIESQWQKAGFDISGESAILSTLYNIGFEKSKPNISPKTGGSVITIHGKDYSFGGLAGSFYSSDELVEFFPRS